MNKANLTAIGGVLAILAGIAAAIFLTAWTLHYWQAWVFLAVLTASTLALVVDWMVHDPAMLEKRMSARAADEGRGGQRLVQAFRPLGTLVVFLLPVLDHRFGWSHV